MATHEVDQKILGRLANATAAVDPLLSSALYRLLGLSILLTGRLYRARKLRKLDNTRDTKSLQLYHHIIWLSREGLVLLEIYVLPASDQGQYGSDLRILGAKLRASFYHVFCLFHNQPPISQLSVISPTLISSQQAGPLSPIQGNGQKRRPTTSKHSHSRNNSGASPYSNKENATPSQTPTNAPAPTRRSPAQERKAALRDAIPSMTSEASYITNPFADSAGPTNVTPPPGLPPLPPLHNQRTPHTIPQPSAFLLPLANFLPAATRYFIHTSTLATRLLPGSAPLRLSVALEHCAFLWDCTKDHEAARRLAKRAIADVLRAGEGMEDEEFEDAKGLVAMLGVMMKRKSADGTPRTGVGMGVGSPVDLTDALRASGDGGTSLGGVGPPGEARARETAADPRRSGESEGRKRSAEGERGSGKEKRHSGGSGGSRRTGERQSGGSGEGRRSGERHSGGSGDNRRSGERHSGGSGEYRRSGESRHNGGSSRRAR